MSQVTSTGSAPTEPTLTPDTLPRHLWLVALLVGAAVWIVGAVVTEITDDTILVPNIIILGTFLVPVCTVLFCSRVRARRT